MRAMLMKSFAGPDAMVMAEVDSPRPADDEVRIDVHAAGLNFADTLMVAGKYQVKPALPFSAGMEAAGIVSALGRTASRFALGDRVMVMCSHGGFAEQVCVAEQRVFRLPHAVDMISAAAFPVIYGTAYHALVDRARLQVDEWMVVYGAGSGVGLAAVELGAVLGARVIAVAGSKDKLDVARSRGAEVLVNYRQVTMRDEIRRITGGGADIFFDPVGGDLFDESLRCIAPEGRLLVVGFASGRIPSAAANLLLLKGCEVVGVNTTTLIRKDLATYARRFDTLLRWTADGRLRPLVSEVFALEDTPAAMRVLAERRATGKIVVRVRDEQTGTRS